MRFKAYSWLPEQPCHYLQFDGCNILLDTCTATTSFDVFMPMIEFSNYSPESFPVPANNHPRHTFLKTCDNLGYVDTPPEIHPVLPPPHVIRSLDAVLISNIQSFLALPYLIFQDDFRGLIYTTEPVIEFAKVLMEDMVTFYERSARTHVKVDRREEVPKWKVYDFWNTLNNKPFSNPNQWMEIFSREDIINLVARITPIFLNEKIVINNCIECIATPSGHHIGSCNWVIKNGMQKISYITSSSIHHTHNKCFEYHLHEGADILLLNSMNVNPTYSFQASLATIKGIVSQTLAEKGTVIFPVCSVSLLLELIIALAPIIIGNTTFSDCVINYVAPNAKTMIAYASRFPEYLVSHRRNRCCEPADPFEFNELIRTNKLKLYEGLTDDLSKNLKQSSIIIVGHPSLRMGEVIHFLYVFGNAQKNSIVQTEPNYPFENIYGPYKSFNIKSFMCPLDYSLDRVYVNEKLIPKIAPKTVLLPEFYNPQMTDLSGNAFLVTAHHNVEYYKYGETMTFKPTFGIKEVLISEGSLSTLKLTGTVERDIPLHSLKGHLSATDNNLTISSYDHKNVYKPLTKTPFYGKVNVPQFIQELGNLNCNFSIDSDLDDFDGCIITLQPPGTGSICVNNQKQKTLIKCPDPILKEKIINTLTRTLNSF
uniref:Lactamase_B domain-containing protein n=1 Tax=Rhabditophanes sp. KR3021 TaxID=114890 RepID=A0AC35TX05_9BILA